MEKSEQDMAPILKKQFVLSPKTSESKGTGNKKMVRARREAMAGPMGQLMSQHACSLNPKSSEDATCI